MSELSPDAKEILATAQALDGPTTGDRARVRRAVMVAAGAALATSTAASASALGSVAAAGASPAAAAGAAGVGATTLGGVALAKVFVAVALVGPIGAGSAISLSSRDASVEAPTHAKNVTPRWFSPSDHRSGPAPQAPPGPLATPREAVVLPAATPAATTPAPATSAAPGPAPSGRDDLSAETALLAEAHAALSEEQAPRALELLDRHAAKYPRSALEPERAAERVLVLCRLGRTFEARVDADRFLRAHPRSPLGARVRASCGTSEP